MTSVPPSNRAGKSSATHIDPQIRKVAQQFEAIFVRQMIGEMRSASLGDDLFGSSATDNFREIADARTAEAIAARGQFGIAHMIEQQLSKGKEGDQ
jgi:flagellar protein FlgJ